MLTDRRQEKLLHSACVRRILTSGALVSPNIRASSRFVLPVSSVEVHARGWVIRLVTWAQFSSDNELSEIKAMLVG
jgi:hypothetical protein